MTHTIFPPLFPFVKRVYKDCYLHYLGNYLSQIMSQICSVFTVIATFRKVLLLFFLLIFLLYCLIYAEQNEYVSLHILVDYKTVSIVKVITRTTWMNCTLYVYLVQKTTDIKIDQVGIFFTGYPNDSFIEDGRRNVFVCSCNLTIR